MARDPLEAGLYGLLQRTAVKLSIHAEKELHTECAKDVVELQGIVQKLASHKRRRASEGAGS